MAEVRITEITLARGEADREIGVLARFAFDLAPIRVRGCALIRGFDGELVASLPRCRASHAEIRFTDHETRMQVTRAALAAYHALGGVLPAP